MEFFKASVSKGQKRFNLVLKANSQLEAKTALHKEGYSVLSIEKNTSEKFEGTKFYFEISFNGETKNGAIFGKDIFKVYTKLRDDLHYDVKYIHPNKGASLQEKMNTLHGLEEQYNLSKTFQKTKTLKKVDETKVKKINTNNTETTNNFYLKKELEKVYKLIDFVLFKIENIVSGEYSTLIGEEALSKLKKIRDSIKQIKKSTNIKKLKQIGELALIKVGEVEKSILEVKKDKKSRELLKDTNKILKKLGSKRQINESDITIKDKIIGFFSQLNRADKPAKVKNKIDKTNFYYLKNLALLNKYEEKLKIVKADILKSFIKIFSFKKENMDLYNSLLFRKKIIQQNITLLRLKVKGDKFSYTKLKKGYNSFIDLILKSLSNFREVVLNLSLLFAIFFILFQNIIFYTGQNYIFSYLGIYLVLLAQILYILSYYTKGLFSVIFNFVFFFIIIIFSIINF